MKWAIDDPARFLRERAEVERLEREEGWLTSAWTIGDGGSIAVDIDITVHGRTYEGRLIYPDVFPNSPPFIRPRDESELWSGHQYGAGGSLCLQWRADNWQPEVTGADMIRSAHELLNTEKDPEHPQPVPSAHRLTSGQELRVARRRLVATQGLLQACCDQPMPSITDFQVVTMYSIGTSLTRVLFVPEISDAFGLKHEVPDVPKGIADSIRLFRITGPGRLVRNEAFDQPVRISNIDDLVKALSDLGMSPSEILQQEAGKYTSMTVALLGTEASSLRVLSVDGSAAEVKLTEVDVIHPPIIDVRIPIDSAKIASLRIGIVGLGSIGSKIAISLARSGAKRFLLVDDDYLVPGNMVRHELSWENVGVHKVDALREQLALIAPGVEADTRLTRISGQESATAAAAALKDLADCDVLIDATANPEVFLTLAAIAKQNQKPLCWGEVFAGGYGGLMARARPDIDPNPLAVRDALYAHLETLPPAPFQRAAGYDVGQDEPLLAHDSDVGFVASAMTRLVIDTALKRNPSDFPHAIYLMGLRAEWIFAEPFDTHPIDAHGRGWAVEGESASQEDRIAVVGMLLKLHEGATGADSDPAA